MAERSEQQGQHSGKDFERYKKAIREVPNFPKPGINFYDITTLLKDGALLSEIVETLAARHETSRKELRAVVAIESRGFILGAAIAQRLGIGFVPVRKFGRLPSVVVRASYSLEYGTDSVELHKDALEAGDQVLVIDDLLATGGTARAAGELVTGLGAVIREFLFMIELKSLRGRERLSGAPVFSLLQYE